MSSREQLDDRLNAACADGRMTIGDADEIRRFADFLAATAGMSDREKADVYLEHYPDDGADRVGSLSQTGPISEGTAS